MSVCVPVRVHLVSIYLSVYVSLSPSLQSAGCLAFLTRGQIWGRDRGRMEDEDETGGDSLADRKSCEARVLCASGHTNTAHVAATAIPIPTYTVRVCMWSMRRKWYFWLLLLCVTVAAACVQYMWCSCLCSVYSRSQNTTTALPYVRTKRTALLLVLLLLQHILHTHSTAWGASSSS